MTSRLLAIRTAIPLAWFGHALCNCALASPAAGVSRYNVVWESPSQDATGVMPLGNGDLAAGVYAIEESDLFLLLAKNDAYTWQGDLFKTGRVRVSLTPNPFEKGKPFRQTLDLPTGSVRIEADGVTIRIWADANRPLYHVTIDSPRELAVTARPEFWKRFDACSYNVSNGYALPPAEPVQDVRLDREGKILWYYAVGGRSIYPDDLKFYGMEHMAAEFPDPLRHHTFGNLLESPDLSLHGGVLSGSGRSFDIRIHALAMQAPEAETWIRKLEQQAAQPIDAAADWGKHCAWWAAFWERSWIRVSDRAVAPEWRERFSGEAVAGRREEEDGAALVAQAYNVFRYLMASQSRGRVQAKFNGGLFTQPLRVKTAKHRTAPYPQPDGSFLTHEDDRLWGRRFTYQNQRLLYWPLLASGDFDLMQPFFRYYRDLLPVRQAVTKAWFGHEGAYYRENIEPTGGERDCGEGGKPLKVRPGENKGQGYYHSFYFTSGLETTAMMLDYVNHTGDAAFRDTVLVPFAREVLLFFDKHYPRDSGGKLQLDPGQVLETWWVSVNAAPDVAGLHFCLDGLMSLKAGTPEDQAGWRKLRDELPEIHVQTLAGRPAIAPAARWDIKRNAENGELYPVFPFRCFGAALGSGDLVAWTMQHRTVKDAFGCACWTQDQIHWACAGDASEAARGLVRRFRIASPMCRFPLYGKEGPDSCPDFDHFGAGSVALQRMLVQEGGGKIHLLPAWPSTWDAEFKLHLSQGAVVRGSIKDGKLASWDVTPASRRNDVLVCPLQEFKPAGPVVPPNAHPLRAGSDQNGGSKFKGSLGRVSLFRGKLSPGAVRELAGSDRAKAVSSPQVVGSWLNPAPGEVLSGAEMGFGGPLSLEAWICPAEKEAGRILDKLTAGKNDGLLWDTYPGLGLRLICGSLNRSAPGVLNPGAWQHVAVVMDGEGARFYVAGQQVP